MTRHHLLPALLLLAAGCHSAPDADIRDIRPRQIERGDRVVVEASRPLWTVGAPATVVLKGVFVDRHAVELPGRVVTPTIIHFDADATLEKAGRRIGNCTWLQVNTGGKKYESSPTAPFALDLFPQSLKKLSVAASDGLTHARLLKRLGLEVEQRDGGVVVTAVAEGKLAAARGIKAGDRITVAAGRPVATIADLKAAWDGEPRSVPLLGKRDGADVVFHLPGRLGVPAWILWAAILFAVALVLILLASVVGGFTVVWERKLSGYMQVRYGPNRVGPAGWFQWLADGLKLILKEDAIPTQSDPILFRIAPYFTFVGLFLVWMVIPFSGWVIVADLDIGMLFMLSVTSLGVVAIVMGGWSSNSKWSLLGGMRSAAQIISYELPASIALLSIATLTGSLSTQAIVRAQGGAPWSWYIFHSPFTFVAFFVYFISALAEGNRTPFDLPEAESELVAGYFTEYSGFRMAIYPLVEWINVYVLASLAAMLFLGGWRLPTVEIWQQDASGWLQLLGFVVYQIKVIALIFVIVWIRWTLPRLRIDQLMGLCWKYLIPTAFVLFIGTLAWAWLVPERAQYYSRFAWFVLGGLLPAAYFFLRVRHNQKRYKDINFQPAATAR